jgi:hypothetical protein
MRTAFLILATVTFCCCKKKVDSFSNIRDKLINKWELRQTYGGLGPGTTYPPGNGHILEFVNHHSYYSYNKDTIAAAGSYRLNPTAEKGLYGITFYRDGASSYSDIMTLKGDTLEFPAECCDIPGAIYIKIN